MERIDDGHGLALRVTVPLLLCSAAVEGKTTLFDLNTSHLSLSYAHDDIDTLVTVMPQN